MIDYWIIKYITAIGKLPVDVCNKKLHNLMRSIEKIRAEVPKYGFKKKYIGSYINEIIADKLRRLTTEKHAPYLPYVKKRSY